MAEDAGETSSTISGGTFHAPVLQGRDFSNVTVNIGQAAAAPVALAQLPPLVSGFTGRKAEMAQVAGLLDPAGDAGAVMVSAVAGLAGVGKTALAIQAGHAARAAGWFPGGVLFIDLHGYDDAPVQPGQALDSLLRALDYPQSGERFRGQSKIQAQRGGHPAERHFTILRIRGGGDLWVSECVITYDGTPTYAVSVMEFTDGLVTHETQYFADPFPAPASRAALAEPIPGRSR